MLARFSNVQYREALQALLDGVACLHGVRGVAEDGRRAHRLRNAASSNEVAWPTRAMALLVFPFQDRAEDLDQCNAVAVDKGDSQEAEEDVLDIYLVKASSHGYKLDKHASAG